MQRRRSAAKDRSRSARRVPGKVPLTRAVSKLGLGSRTQAEAWVREGRLSVDGVVRNNPNFLVVPETARLELDGKPLKAGARRTFVFHKPKGLVTTRSDEKGRATIFDPLKELESTEGLTLHAVGRLDQATTGLLILTNDTRLSAWLTDPANGVPRVYVVSVRGEMTEEKCRTLEKGVKDEGEVLRAERVELRKASGRESHLTVTLAEGRNREVRRLLGALGHEVTKLKRVSFGGLRLGDLEPGAWRELSAEELHAAFPALPARDRARRG